MRYSISGHLLVYVSIFYVCPVEDISHLKSIAHAGNIRRYRTISKRDQYLRPLTNNPRLLFIFVTADRALDKGHVNVFRKLVSIDYRAVHEIHLVDQTDDAFIDVKKR